MCLFHTMQQLQRVLRNGLWHSVLFASICWDGLLSSAKLMIEQIWLCSEIQLQKISLFVSRCIICTYIYICIYLSIPFQYQPLQYKITEIKRKARVWGLDWTLILVKSSSCPWSAWVEHPHKSQNVSAFAMDRYGLNSFDFAARCCTLSPSRGWARSNDPALLHWQPHTITKLSPCWSKMAPNKSLIPRDESLQVLPLQCGKSQPATRSAQSLKPNDILSYC